MTASADSAGMLNPDQLRDVDESLLELLEEGRVTPVYCRKRLDRDYDAEYTRSYIQQRLARLVEHNHVTNLLDAGLYELTDDPRDSEK